MFRKMLQSVHKARFLLGLYAVLMDWKCDDSAI